MTLTHVHPGSHFLGHLGEAGVPGARVEWVDILSEGPVRDLGDSAVEREERARALEAFGASGAPERLAAQDASLAAAGAAGEEIVLWIGDDLFCQLNLLRLVTLLERRGALDRTSLAGPGPSDPETGACRLEALSRGQILAAYARREPVRGELRAELRAAWSALVAPDPAALVRWSSSASTAVPALRAACRRLLLEYPDWRTGLSRAEELAIGAMAPGDRWSLERGFLESGRQEPRRWLTDSMFRVMIGRLASGPRPHVVIEREPGAPPGLRDGYRLTEFGIANRSAAGPWTERLRIDRWIGGVHVTNEQPWSRRGKDVSWLESPHRGS